MKLSVVISILNSHEIVRRQIEHFKKMDLPDDIEFIFVDDGSDPPLKGQMKNLNFYYTMDKRPWTQGLARNLGASQSRGEYLLFTDIDHIITRGALMASLDFTGDKMVFPRYWGLLNENGDIINDKESLLKFGLDPARLRGQKGRSLCAGIHGNTYAIRREIFNKIGGYDPRLCQSMFHMGGRYMSEERKFNIQFDKLIRLGAAKDTVIGPNIYTFPVSKFRADRDNNPQGLFHGLSLEQPA
jgi:glycosyltransferase involved in cell wall biosynthesis